MASFIIRALPNTLTCCNLISGVIATKCAFDGQFDWALTFIVIGAVFDFFDGFAAEDEAADEGRCVLIGDDRQRGERTGDDDVGARADGEDAVVGEVHGHGAAAGDAVEGLPRRELHLDASERPHEAHVAGGR